MPVDVDADRRIQRSAAGRHPVTKGRRAEPAPNRLVAARRGPTPSSLYEGDRGGPHIRIPNRVEAFLDPPSSPNHWFETVITNGLGPVFCGVIADGHEWP